MPPVVLKLFDGQTDKAETICFPFWEA